MKVKFYVISWRVFVLRCWMGQFAEHGSICWTIQRWFQGCTWRERLKPPKFTRLSSAPKHFSKCLFINKNIYLACLSVCSFVSNKLQNNWTDYAQISCGTSRDPREVLRMIQLKKISFCQNSIFWKFWELVIFFIKSVYFC